jgi:hypothetical protein
MLRDRISGPLSDRDARRSRVGTRVSIPTAEHLVCSLVLSRMSSMRASPRNSCESRDNQ